MRGLGHVCALLLNDSMQSRMKRDSMILAADDDRTRQRCVGALQTLSNLDLGIVVPMSIMELHMPATRELFATKNESVLGGLMAALGSAPVFVEGVDDADVYLQQLQSAMASETVAAIRFYRNIEFAIEICEDTSLRADGMVYDEAVKSLRVILASQPNPAPHVALVSALASARLAVPHLQEALDAGKARRVGQQVAELRAVR
jgi:hypothetical protein